MCKAFESNLPLPEDESQAEASEEPAPQPSPLKRKGKEVASEVPRKKSKLSAHIGGDFKIGREDKPLLTTPRRGTRSVASASRSATQTEPRARAPPSQAAPPSSSPKPSTRSAQSPSSGSAPAPRAPEPPKRPPSATPADSSGLVAKKLKLKLKTGSVYVLVRSSN